MRTVVYPDNNRANLIISIELKNVRGQALLDGFNKLSKIKFKISEIRHNFCMRGRILTSVRRNEICVRHRGSITSVSDTNNTVKPKPLKVGVNIVGDSDLILFVC